MAARPLKHTELITLEAKDEEYFKKHVGDPIHDIGQNVLGVRRWLKFRELLTVISRLGYTAQTSLSNIPTLGEEFCDAFTTSNSNLTRALLGLLFSSKDNLIPLSPLQFLIPKPFLHLLDQVHAITFYIFGDHFRLPNRLSNLLYRTRTIFTPQTDRTDNLFRMIGLFMMLKLILEISQDNRFKGQTASTNVKKSTTLHSSREASNYQSEVCMLCCETRVEPTAVECGHVFCWVCICKWLKDRDECPLCRKTTSPNRLIHLINFR